MSVSIAQGANYDANLLLEAARHSLEAIVGTSIGNLHTKYELAKETPSLEWEECLERLQSESPLLKSQAAELEAARTEIRLADAQGIPNVTAQMVAQRDSTDRYSSIGTFVAIANIQSQPRESNVKSANTSKKSPKSLQSQFGQKCDHNSAYNTYGLQGLPKCPYFTRTQFALGKWHV